MVKIDFSTLQSKYPLLNSGDISFLNKYFGNPEIVSKFEEIEKYRKKKLIVFYIIGIIIFFPIYALFNRDFGFQHAINIFMFLLLISGTLFLLYKILGFFMDSPFSDLKQTILPGFAGAINKDLKYSPGKKYYFGEEGILEYGKLLDRFDRIDLVEDSIFFEPVINTSNKNTVQSDNVQLQENIPVVTSSATSGIEYQADDTTNEEQPEKVIKENVPFTIEGYEIKTSEKHKDKNGNEYYTVNNHCYLLKITFNNARRRFEEGISLLRDINDNLILKSFKVLGIDFAIIAGYFYLTQPKHGDNLGIQLILYLAGLINVPVGVFCITIFIVMYIITYQIYTKLINKNRVKTENTQFEKEFDVYCEDQVKSREVLTPSFMYRIYDFVNKIDARRVYEFYFSDNSMYIKLNFLNSRKTLNYLEVSSKLSIKENMMLFVNFYLELKNVTVLAHDLGLEYFDKDTFENTIIK